MVYAFLLYICFFLSSHLLPMDLNVAILPVVNKNLSTCSLSLAGSRLKSYQFVSRCKVNTLTTCQPMVEFYLHTFSRFPLRMAELKSCFDKNRTHDFRTTSRCAGYLLDHSGDEVYPWYYRPPCGMHSIVVVVVKRGGFGLSPSQ